MKKSYLFVGLLLSAMLSAVALSTPIIMSLASGRERCKWMEKMTPSLLAPF